MYKTKIKQVAQPRHKCLPVDAAKVVSYQKNKEKKAGLGQLEPVKSFKINYTNENAHTSLPLEGQQNALVLERLENLNSQLSLFLKTYKLIKNQDLSLQKYFQLQFKSCNRMHVERIRTLNAGPTVLNNYVVINQNKKTLIKKLNHLIIKNKFLVNASLLNNTNQSILQDHRWFQGNPTVKSIEFLTKGNFNKLKKYEKQVLLNPDNHNLLINFLANNKVFAQRKNLPFRTENYACKINKNFLLESNTFVTKTSRALLAAGLSRSSLNKQTNLDFSTSGHNSGRVTPKAHVRTYNFLQISLIKYLAISKKRPEVLCLHRTYGPKDKINSLASGLKIKPIPKDYALNFLLKDKINNKSFLTYWLIPLAGLAFLSPNTFLYTNRQLPIYLISLHKNHPQLTNKFKERNIRCFNNLNLYINTKNLAQMHKLQQGHPQQLEFNKTFLNTAPSNLLSSHMLSKNISAYTPKGQVETCFARPLNFFNACLASRMQEYSLTEYLRSHNKLNTLSTRLPKRIITDSHPLFGNFKNTLLKNIQGAYLADTSNNLMPSQTIAIQNLNLISDSPLSQKGLFQTKPFKGYLVASAKSKSSLLLKTVTFSTTRAYKANLINPLFSQGILEKNLNYLTTSASDTNKKTLKLLKLKIFDYTRLNNKNKILDVPSIAEQAKSTLPFSLMANQKPLVNYKKTLKKLSMTGGGLFTKPFSCLSRQDVINLSKSNQSWTKSLLNIKEFFNEKSTINLGSLTVGQRYFEDLPENKVYIHQTMDTPSQILFNSFTQDFTNKSYQKINGLFSRHQGLNNYTFEKNLAFKNTGRSKDLSCLSRKNKVFTNYFSILGIGQRSFQLANASHMRVEPTALNLQSKLDIAAQDKEQASVTRNNTLIWAKDQTNPHKISLLPKKINLIITNTKNVQNVFTQANLQDTGVLLFERQEAVKDRRWLVYQAGLHHSILSKPFKVYGTKNLITKAIYKEKILEIKGSLNLFGPVVACGTSQLNTFNASLSNRLINQKLLTNNESLTNSYFNYITKKLKKFIFSNNVINTKIPIISKRKTLVYSLVKPEVKGSISMIFKLKKMFKNNIVTDVKSVTKPLNSSLEEEGLNQRRLSAQKKRKAKKQRLETRQRKKRTRFFPRPTWLRYRMFVDFLKQRNLTSLMKPNSAMLRLPLKNYLVPNAKRKSTLNTSFFFSEEYYTKKTKFNLFKHTQKINYPRHKCLPAYAARQLGLANIKTQGNLKPANYKDFELSVTNQPPIDKDKDKDKDTIFRDLWVWGYNNTTLNNYQQNLMFLLPNNTNILNTQKAGLATIAPKIKTLKTFNFSNKMHTINHNLNRGTVTGIGFDGSWQEKILQTPELINKFVFLKDKLSLKDLRPQVHYVSKLRTLLVQKDVQVAVNVSNKSKILQNKNVFILTRLQWALNKTQTNTFTEGNKRYTLWGQRKLRNQSKNNKTKYLEKQFITNWERFFLNKKINHLYKNIGNKIQQKITKLNYLTTYSKYPNNMSQLPCTSSRVTPEAIARATGFNSQRQLGPTNKPFSKDSIKINQYLQTAFPYTENITLFNNAWWTNLAKNLSYSSSKIKSKHTTTINTFLNNDLAQLGLNIDNNLLDNKNTVNISSTVIFHFCALISLVSISQVRCFIKFYIIFLYKLKNVYLFLITKISGVVEKKVSVINSSNKALNKTLKPTRQAFLKQAERDLSLPQVHTNTFKVDINNSTGGKNTHFMHENKQRSSASELKLFTLFGLNLLKKHFSLRSETDKILKKATKPSQISLRQKSFSFKKKIMFELARSSNKGFRFYNFNSTKTSISVNNQTFTKSNLISLKENFKRQAFLKGSSTTGPLCFQVAHATSTERRPSGRPNSYKTKKIQFFLKKNTLTFFQSKKKFVFKSVFMFVDLFQLGIRSIKNFFFKPAEFTTNWVAFAFLVEWSSDLITIIPENIDIYLWTAFAKVSRNTNNLLIWNKFGIQTNNKFPMFFVLNNSSTSENIVANLVQTTQSKNLALLQLPSLILLNYLIQRRILYLFDKFIFTISQPDADLMRRQIKGTRFWDIWADFLVFFADYYNVNVFALSTIKAEQNNLIEKITNSTWLDKTAWFGFKNLTSSGRVTPKTTTVNLLRGNPAATLPRPTGLAPTFGGSKLLSQGSPRHLCLACYGVTLQGSIPSFQQKQIQTPNDFFNKYNLLAQVDKELDITNINRWSINQYITYQSWHSHNGSNNSNGDLFIDYHPPKSFSHLPNIKYNKILLRPIGTLVCQINSGLLKRQVSKNILLVSPKNTSDSNGLKETVNKPGSNRDQILTDYNILLIQALAGETELKIITDNAQRYALVNRGFAVGIKLLRDVFDAISLNTPCIFLLLDIHTIGERRPMLISDYGAKNTDDNGLFKEDFFGSQRDEVHEKNQVVYQLTRHAIAHYRKPFKGDYSLAIPTNLYSFQELARSLPTQTTTNLSLISFNNVTIKPKINYNNPNKTILNKKSKDKPAALVMGTHLKIKTLNKKIAPPSTSPFTVLLLKEEKKLKPNKIVEEFPWTGLPGEELATKARTSYSVRAKVSMLAELSLSNLSAKLDMITDLLVIIDSVRSNKGFVVFATTNVPQVLDPALRRPGRLDETICIPNISSSAILNFTTNYEIIKSVKHNFSGSALFSYTLPGVQFNKNLAFLVKNNCSEALIPSVSRSNVLANYARLAHNKTHYSLSTMLLANKRKILTVNLFDLNTVLKEKASNFNHNLNNYSLISDQNKRKRKSINYSKKQPTILRTVQNNAYINTPTSSNNLNFARSAPWFSTEFDVGTKLSIKALAYYQVGNILLNYYLNNYAHISSHTSLGKAKTLVSGKENKINYLTWDTKNIVIKQLMSLFGGKISQLLAIEKNLSFNAQHLNQDRCFGDSKTKLYESYKDNLFNFDMSDISATTKNFQIATKIMLSFIHKRYLYRKNLIVPKLLSFSDGTVIDEPPSPPFSSLLIPAKRFENYTRVFSDLIAGTKLGQRKSQISFTEKLNYHMELQSIKLLKNQSGFQSKLPTVNGQKSSTSTKSHYETLLKMTIADKQLQSPTNITWYYQNRILKRHGQYLTNQWWNGQLSEHNAESVFLSDIDWRSSFIQNKQIQVKPAYAGYNFLVTKTLGNNPVSTASASLENQDLSLQGLAYAEDTSKWPSFQLANASRMRVQRMSTFIKKNNPTVLKNTLISLAKTKEKFLVQPKQNKHYNSSGLDILLDFPDTDQYYNPRRRRWLLNKGDWSFWFNFDKVYSEEIISSWILESLINTYTYVHNNLELLDFITTKFITLGYTKSDKFTINVTQTESNLSKEIILTNAIKRF